MEITLTTIHPQHAAIVRAQVPHDGIGEFLGRAFGQVFGVLTQQGVGPAGAPFARYDFAGDGFLVEAGFPTTSPISAAGGVEPIELPGGDVVTTTYVGAYAGVSAAYQAIEAWMAEHEVSRGGAPWESYLDGPEVAEPRTVVTWPVASTR